jgi:hypothetical protein
MAGSNKVDLYCKILILFLVSSPCISFVYLLSGYFLSNEKISTLIAMFYWIIFNRKFNHEVIKYTHFDIISNDADLDFVVDLLISQGRSAKRIATIKQPPPQQELLEDKIRIIKPLQKYCIYLTQHEPRPAKSKSLLNNIDRFFKESVNPNEVLTKLIKKGVVSINHGVVTYNHKRLLEQAHKI